MQNITEAISEHTKEKLASRSDVMEDFERWSVICHTDTWAMGQLGVNPSNVTDMSSVIRIHNWKVTQSCSGIHSKNKANKFMSEWVGSVHVMQTGVNP